VTRRVGYVLKRFPRLSETFVAAELVELQRQGEHVTVFAISRPDEAVRHAFLDELRLTVVYLPYRPVREPIRVVRALVRAARAAPRGLLRASAYCLWPPRRKGLRRLLQAVVLRDELVAARIDHAHAHFATAAARLANLAWRMDGPTYSVTAHAKDIWHSEVRADHLRDKLGHATFVATVSEQNRLHLGAVLGRDAAVHVVPNSVDLRRLCRGPRRRPEPRLVVSVARLVEKKGLADLVEACARLHRGGRQVRLEVAGDGPERRALEHAAVRARLDVTFHGALAHERVVDLYRRACVFALPCVVSSNGDRDGLPTAVLEAMALGVPVVTTSVNGLADLVVHGETGLVVPEHAPDALAEAIARLLDTPRLADRLAVAARTRVEAGFALERSASRLRALFPPSLVDAASSA
jgi:colanic acid/amylovoran biosynthesis glycosyltransferase